MYILDKINNGIFIVLQIKSFGPKENSNYMKGLKSVVLAIFQKGFAWPCPVITGPQKGQNCDQKLERQKKTIYTLTNKHGMLHNKPFGN